MATPLTKPITRTVVDEQGNPLLVTITAEGILFRRPRKREQWLLPFTAGETRAQMLAARLAAPAPPRRARISRSLL